MFTRASPKFEQRSRGSGAPHARAPLGCTHSRLPTGPLRTACWEPGADIPTRCPRWAPSARTGGVFCSTGRLIASPPSRSHLPRREPPQALRSRLEDAPLEQVMALVCRVKEGCGAGRTW